MGRPTGMTGVAAGLATGAGLWFTRAALDVVPVATGSARVAMFPSWPDLAGLTCLVLLTAFLARSVMVRLGRTHAGGIPRPGRVPTHLLLPLTLALLLGLPYLPWLPDALPAVRVLAGPARFGVWVVACGLTAWLAWERHREARDSEPSLGMSRAWRCAAVFALSAALFGGAAIRLAGHGLYPGGDEPHYLVIAQSVLADRDLAIENNHQRRDYAEYFARTLDPDYIARGRDGAIYSIHPIGLPLLAVPALALGGYAWVVALLVVVAAAGATLLWSVGRRVSGSAAAATTGWLAAAGSVPFVLHSFAVYPEVPAALCALAALCWPSDRKNDPPHLWALRGVAVAMLPWLSTKYAPMSAVIVVALALRAKKTGSHVRLAAAVVPWAASVTAWLAFFWWVWGTPLPTAPYGTAHQTSLANLLVGAPALLFDQEYGVLPYAPALVFVLPGLWRLWQGGGDDRRLSVEIALALAALGATVGAYQMWWGGSAAPGRQVAAGVLLAGVPIAKWDAHVGRQPLRRALLRVLTLVGLATSVVMVTARGGLLIANGRDGASQWLEWLAPGRELVRALPSAIAMRDHPGIFLGMAAAWVVLAIAVSWLSRRWRPSTPGHAGAAAGLWACAALVIGASGVPAVFGNWLPPAVSPQARVESSMLQDFDAVRRPVAVLYTPWRVIEAASVPTLFRFEGAPGLRRQPQPLRVVLNTRLSLPAGDYTVRLVPASGAGLRGNIGLQVGRMGPPMVVWALDEPAGASWSAAFTLGVDSNFVGLRGARDLDARIASVEVSPIRVQNESERHDAPTVLAAMRYGHVAVYFHGSEVYPERTGFWVRGRSTLPATFVQEPPADVDPSVLLKLHSGAAANTVRVETPVWSTSVDLQPGEKRDLRIPARPGTRRIPVRITPAGGFVPADRDGGGDRRLLGCWVEVVD